MLNDDKPMNRMKISVITIRVNAGTYENLITNNKYIDQFQNRTYKK